ncbi:MAG TPA: L,D-transpeptidase family protein [Thermoanaerobaculia bacterium]|nr:L,D-transpeptidase family protein [Thermoanaerobaculia bacterium]
MNSRRIDTLRRVLATASFAFLAFAGCRQREIPPEVSQTIQATVQSQTVPAAIRDEKERKRAWAEMRHFYEQRKFQPAWLTAQGPRPQAQELLKAIDASATEGLDPRRYQKDRLASLLKEVENTKSYDDPAAQRLLAYTDMHLSYTFLTLAAHLATGRQQPETLRIDWYTKPRNVDLDARLEKALAEKGNLDDALRTLRPPEDGYKPLVDALNRYRQIAAQGGWPTLAPSDELKPGSRGEQVGALKNRLRAEGYLSAAQQGEAAKPETYDYDKTLADAVARFQKLHGLEVTGKVDEDTLAELNVPAAERLEQIRLNLERWRWMPSDFGQRYIRVNIPEYEMALINNGQTELEMRVVVGKAQQSRTPVFSDKMTYVELNPAWNIPTKIAEEEILPKVANNPGYLASHNMEMVQEGSHTRIRQRPGPDNPLGQIKFMFPNEHDIYLHDTPAEHLFAETERDFSHGCIRLEKPMDLAHVLLKDSEWTPEKLQEAVASGEQKTISLPHPLPVHLLYFTAWVDKDGTVEFRRDVYGHDAKLAKALAEEPIVELDLDAVRGQVRAAK